MSPATDVRRGERERVRVRARGRPTRAGRRRRTLAWVVGTASVLLLAGIAGLLAWRYFGDAAPAQEASSGRPPAVVAAATAQRETWRLEAGAVGTVRAYQGIAVTAETAGKVVEIAFDAGARVDAGDPLVSLDTGTERAALQALEARLAQARADLARYRRLIARGAVARAELEQAATQVRTLEAQAAQQRTQIDKKTIVAPFAGRLGIRRVSEGQLITPGTPIVDLQALKPALVDFTLPERRFSQVRTGQRVEVTVAAWPDRRFAGRITAIDPGVTASNRSLQVQATVANEAELLRPGMFADVVVDLGEAREVVAVPATAITFNAYGESVFVVGSPGDRANDAGATGAGANEPDPTEAGATEAGITGAGTGGAGDERPAPAVARRAFVETGERRGKMIEVLKGLDAGQRVVTAGQLKIDGGAPLLVSGEDALARADRSGPAGPGLAEAGSGNAAANPGGSATGEPDGTPR
ncbi:MAG: efflux RND transporter periplasmic adaptor subunit [Lautropia sp.]